MAIPRLNVILGADKRPLTKSLNELKSDIERLKRELNDAKDPIYISTLNKNIKQASQNIQILEGHGLKAKKSFAELGKGLAIGLGIAVFQQAQQAASQFFNGAITEALEARRAAANFKQTLESVGRLDLFDPLSQSAKDLATQFGYLDNDDVTAGFTKLIQFGGLTEKQIRDLIPVIVDLNAKQRLAGESNKSVAETAEEIVKALSGQGRELKKYGIDVKESSTLTERLGVLTGTLAEKVRGAADAYGNSLEGRLETVNQKLRDQQELLGEKLLPMKLTLISFANQVGDAFSRFFQDLGGNTDTLTKVANEAKFIENAKKNADSIRGSLTGLSDDGLKNLIQPLNDQLNAAVVLERRDKQREAHLRAMIDLIEEEIRLRGDKRLVGTNTGGGGGGGTPVDALANQLKVAKELEGGRRGFFTPAVLELEAKIAIRDAKTAGASAEELAVIQTAYANKQVELQKFLDTQVQGMKLSTPLAFDLGLQTNVQGNAGVGGPAAATNGLNQFVESYKAAGEQAKEAILERSADLTGAIQSGIVGLGEALGQTLSVALEPGATASDIAKPVLNLLIDVVRMIGEAFVQAGVTMLFAKKAATALFSNPATAIAAGIGLIALSAFLKAQLNKKGNNAVKNFAEGGVTTSPTLARTSEYGQAEAIIPLDRLPSLINRITGGGSGGDGYIAETRIDLDALAIAIKKVTTKTDRYR